MFDRGGIDKCFFHNRFQRYGFAAPHAAVSSYDNLGRGILYTHVEGSGTKARKNNAVNCTDTCTGKHCNDLFRHQWHVNADPVSFIYTNFFECICKPHHFAE